MSENWEQDPYVKAWLGKLNSPRTIENYKSTFPKWLTFIQLSPSEQIKQRAEDLTTSDLRQRGRFEDKVIEYKKFLESQNYSAGSVKVYLTSVLSFFSKNRLRLQFSRGDLAVESKKKTVKRWVPNNPEIRAVYQFLDNARDRAILLLMYHSGLNSIDIRKLNIEDLPTLSEDEHNYFEHKREKTDELAKTCISSECAHDILIYLKQRNNPEKGALFVSRQNSRIDNRLINMNIKQAVEKAHPQRVNEWQTKNLRSSYNDALLRAGIPSELKDVLMGHARLGARGSYECSPTTIIQAYQQAFKILSINHGQQARKDIQRLEQEQKQRFDALMEVINKQGERISKLETALKEAKPYAPDELKKMIEDLGVIMASRILEKPMTEAMEKEMRKLIRKEMNEK